MFVPGFPRACSHFKPWLWFQIPSESIVPTAMTWVLAEWSGCELPSLQPPVLLNKMYRRMWGFYTTPSKPDQNEVTCVKSHTTEQKPRKQRNPHSTLSHRGVS